MSETNPAAQAYAQYQAALDATPTGDAARKAREAAAERVNEARRLYVEMLRAAGKGDLADLIARLTPRTWDPDPTSPDETRTGAEYVVDLYGASIGVSPTRDGLRIYVDTSEVPEEHYPILVEVDGHDAGTYRERKPGGCSGCPAGPGQPCRLDCQTEPGSDEAPVSGADLVRHAVDGSRAVQEAYGEYLAGDDTAPRD